MVGLCATTVMVQSYLQLGLTFSYDALRTWDGPPHVSQHHCGLRSCSALTSASFDSTPDQLRRRSRQFLAHTVFHHFYYPTPNDSSFACLGCPVSTNAAMNEISHRFRLTFGYWLSYWSIMSGFLIIQFYCGVNNCPAFSYVRLTKKNQLNFCFIALTTSKRHALNISRQCFRRASLQFARK
jgi:hypothetical protein